MVFYDKKGKCTAFLVDNIYIYLYSGDAVCYIYDEGVYKFDGKHIGWCYNGWITDLEGNVVLFANDRKGDPKSLTGETRAKRDSMYKRTSTLPRVKQVDIVVPSMSCKWSDKSTNEFFGLH